jgi:hypothetical protein
VETRRTTTHLIAVTNHGDPLCSAPELCLCSVDSFHVFHVKRVKRKKPVAEISKRQAIHSVCRYQRIELAEQSPQRLEPFAAPRSHLTVVVMCVWGGGGGGGNDE